MFLCAVPLSQPTRHSAQKAYQNISFPLSIRSKFEHILRMFAIKMSNDRRDLYSSQSATIHWLSLLPILLLQGYGKTKMMIIHVRYDLAHEKRTDTRPRTHPPFGLLSYRHRSFPTKQQFTHSIYFFCLLSFFLYYFVCLLLFLLLLLLLPFASLCGCRCCCFYHYCCYCRSVVVAVVVFVIAAVVHICYEFFSHTIRCYFTMYNIFVFVYSFFQICLGRYVKVI